MQYARSLKPRSIRSHLVALVAAVAVPLLALQTWSSYREYRLTIETAESKALTLADAGRVGTRQFFSVAEGVMSGIANEFGTTLLDKPTCAGVLASVDGVLEFLSNVLVADSEGATVCTTRPFPDGASDNIAKWGWFAPMRSAPGFLVGDPVRGIISDAWVLPIAVPIHGADGAFRGVLAGSVPLLHLQGQMGPTGITDNALVTIATNKRVVITRSEDPEQWLGRVLPPAEEGADRQVRPGQWVASGADFTGVQRAWGQVEIPELGWVVYVGVPARDVYGPAWAAAARKGGLSLAIILLTAVLALALYRKISSALLTIGEGTQAALRGEFVGIPADAPTEVREVFGRLEQLIAARSRAESSERKARERYQSLFDHAVFGMYVSTWDGRLLDVNPALVSVLGYPSGEALMAVGTRSLYRDPQQRQRFLDQHSHGRLENIEAEWLRADGVSVTVRLNGQVITTEEGEPAFEVIVEDITEERRREEELRQTQKMEAVGRLAGGIAHDFNNLLTVIGGNLELLEAGLSADDPARVDVEQIADATERATALTRQLLSFSRKDSRETRVVDLNALLLNLERMLTRLIGEDIVLETKPADGRHAVRGDAGQLEQIVMNLVINARDALPSGGRIEIETRSVAEGASADGHRHGRGVILIVRDNGVGMDADTKSRVFEPFFTTKGESEGTGLGLSTAYGIVRQAGGHIGVTSEPGLGTEFEVWFPIAEGPALVPAEPPRVVGRRAGDETILAVEDESLVRNMVQRILEMAGYHVLTAVDGQEALEIFDEFPGRIDLVLTDVVMPRVKGPELGARLRLRSPEMPVLYMSGYTDDLLVDDRILDDPDLFIAKPFSPGALCARIRALLDRRTAAAWPPRRGVQGAP